MNTVRKFDIATPTRIVFGFGSLSRVGKTCAALGRHPLLLSGQSAMKDLGILGQVADDIRSERLQVDTFEGIRPNPTSDEVDAALNVVRRLGCDVIVGLGGGSVIDVAKAVAVCTDRTSVRELIGHTLPAGAPRLPVIAIPTTAGSGSEVTKGAIITDTLRNVRAGIRGEAIFPTVALVDPSLSASAPTNVAAETGFDALAHSIEGYVARSANPINDALVEKAIRILSRQLPRLARGERAADIYESMAFASLLGGLSVAMASTCLPHRLQQAMGSVKHVELAHGRGLAHLYPAWLTVAYPFAAGRFDRLANLLGGPDIHETISTICEALKVGGSLTRVGFNTLDIDTALSTVSGNLDNDPVESIDLSLMRGIYEHSL